MPLVFVGRLTRREQIQWALHDVFRHGLRRYLISALVLPAIAFAFLLAAGSPIPLARLFGIVVAAYLVGVLVRIIYVVISIIWNAKGQDQDVSLTIDDATLTLASADLTLSVPTTLIRAVRLANGMAGYRERMPIFFLPPRVLSLADRARLERILSVAADTHERPA